MKKDKKPWNHNYAYHKWIAKMIGGRKRILDVGCGDGTLARFLGAADHSVLGLDPSAPAIERANAQNTCDNVAFAQAAFESYDFAAKHSMPSSLSPLFTIWIWQRPLPKRNLC